MSEIENRYENIPSHFEPPPDYKTVCIRDLETDEKLVMTPIRGEMRAIAQRQARSRAKNRQLRLFLQICGFLFFIFLLGIFIWFGFTTSDSEGKTASPPDPYCQKRVIGYYHGMEDRMITEKQIEKLTHIIFDGVRFYENGTIEFRSDSTRKMFLDMKQKVRFRKPGIKILLSNDEELVANLVIMTNAMATSNSRKKWIDSIAEFLTTNGIDGVELSWRSHQPADKKFVEDFALFIRELRYKFTNMDSSYLISVILSNKGFRSETEEDFKTLLDSVDIFNVATDLYHHAWFNDGKIGSLAPLYSSKTHSSIDWIMSRYACALKSPSKLQFTLPFNGASWTNIENLTTSRKSFFPINAIFDGGFVQYKKIKQSGFKLSETLYDEEAKSPYIYDEKGGKVLYFENERSLMEKVSYMMEKNLGGVTVRRLEYDDNLDTLLNAVSSSMEMCKAREFENDQVQYKC